MKSRGLRLAGEPEPPLFTASEREMFDTLNAEVDARRASYTTHLPRADERNASNAFDMADRLIQAVDQARKLASGDPELLRAAVASLCYSQIHVVESLARQHHEDKAASAGTGRRRRTRP